MRHNCKTFTWPSPDWFSAFEPNGCHLFGFFEWPIRRYFAVRRTNKFFTLCFSMATNFFASEKRLSFLETIKHANTSNFSKFQHFFKQILRKIQLVLYKRRHSYLLIRQSDWKLFHDFSFSTLNKNV